MARTLIQSTLSSFGTLSAASIRELCVQGCRESEYPDPEVWKPLLEGVDDKLGHVVACEERLRACHTGIGNRLKVPYFYAVFACLFRQATITPSRPRNGIGEA